MFFAALCVVAALSFALLSALFGQSMAPAQSKQEAAGIGQPKSENAARSVPSSRHFDRVLLIVLENGDYEAATKDPNLAALAAQGASFSNFHALFHPSYPNYLAMISGTDFGVGGSTRLLADMQVDFPDDAAHKTIADRLIANGFDFKNYAEELPEGDCPYQIGKQNYANPKTGGYVRRMCHS
jgi:hypothetical protein